MYKSPDGVTWTSVYQYHLEKLMVSSLDIYDDGTQLIVYLTYGSLDAVRKYPVYYRRLVIPDDTSDPIWGAEQEAVVADYQGLPVIKRDRNGYVHIAFLKMYEYRGKGVRWYYGNPHIIGTTTPDPGDAPTWTAPLQLDAHPEIEFGSYRTKITLTAFGGTGDIAGVVYGMRDTAGTAKVKGIDIVSFDGSTYTIGTPTEISPIYDVDGYLGTVISTVADDSNYAHLLLEYPRYDLRSFKASSPNTVESWEASVVVDTGKDYASKYAMSIDKIVSPNNLYAFYGEATSNMIYHRPSPVDVISWGSETSVPDDTVEIDHFSSSEERTIDALYLIYTRLVEPYEARFYELPVIVIPVETIVAKEFPMTYLESPVKAKELRSKVSGAVITKVSQDYPLVMLKSGKASELRSKWE